jgi:2-oxoglutarate ferredoxin oxidoreductase subunit alpha
MTVERISIKFVGRSGQGIDTVGRILSKAVTESNQYIFASREYPSLIKGGISSYQVDISSKEIFSSSRLVNILCAYTKESLDYHLKTCAKGSLLIYSPDIELDEKQVVYTKKNDIVLLPLDSKTIVKENGGTEIMSNTVPLGLIFRILGFDLKTLLKEVGNNFKGKDINLEPQYKSIEAGFNSALFRPEYTKELEKTKSLKLIKTKKLLMTGNEALALGAITAGVRAYFAYPMTPATSIFKFIGETSDETGILVKQAENEITAIQMSLGSMYMGTRALTATSGGGFDLMIETISCSGISETPLVVILSQRAGAGTGLPTWSGAGDLTNAVKCGHGEFPKCVLAVSDIHSSYTLIQEAFNIAERYQIPVIVLTEKQISESLYTSDNFPAPIHIERGLSDGKLRYNNSDDGISDRWIPSKNKKPYLSSSDEHQEDGSSCDESNNAVTMLNKRMKKLRTLEKELPEPKYYGNTKAKEIFVGWGSVKNTMLDLIQKNKEIGYLHYEYIFPLKTKTLEKLIEENSKNLILVENNKNGQLGGLIKEEIGYEFKNKILKYDGRALTVEDIIEYF